MRERVNPTFTSTPTVDPAAGELLPGEISNRVNRWRGPRPMPIPLLNREISRLDYNRRVLEKAADPSVPLLERLRFLTWCSRNLDEFFMVRAGAVRDLIAAGVADRTSDGLLPMEQLTVMRDAARRLLRDMVVTLQDDILPALSAAGISLHGVRDLPEADQREVRDYFRREILPVLTPLAIDPGHPFPFVANVSLNVCAFVVSERHSGQVVLVRIPEQVPRFRMIGGPAHRFVAIESVIRANLPVLFPGLSVSRAVVFRVLRNAELSVQDDDVKDLRDSVEAELRRRDRKQVVCLEIEADSDDEIVQILSQGTGTAREDVYRVPGLLKMSDLAGILAVTDEPALRYPEFNPRLPQKLASRSDIFSIIRSGDLLLQRPYDSFTAVVELMHAAATDPAVVSIRQTLYQTDEHSPVVEKLVLAALNGKHVVVIIELQARFEESRNIAWARRLQDAGVQVVYGILGLQTHAKLSLIVRNEEGELRRYVHLSTGNYDVDSARGYVDLDLLTANEAFGQDVGQLVNLVTGYSASSLAAVIESGAERPTWDMLVVAPFDQHRWLLRMIGREAEHAAAGRPSGITAKVNSVIDPAVIEALYAASSAGVRIDLIVRAMCTLVPGLEDLSENIRVLSIVDRFLEHSRLVRFENGGQPEIYLSSGDWMPRNFQRRIEVAIPLVDAETRATAARVLEISLSDTASSWELRSNGTWQRRSSQELRSSQQQFIEIARAEALRLGRYEETVREPGRFRRRARKQRRVGQR